MTNLTITLVEILKKNLDRLKMLNVFIITLCNGRSNYSQY
jgi:hypothetical protein